MAANTNKVFRQVDTVHSDSWGWFVFLGVLQIIFGIIVYSYPVLSTVGITTTIAAILVISGVAQFIQFFVLLGKPHNFVRLLRSLVSIVAGALMFRYPQLGMGAVAISLSFYFLVSASIQALLAFEIPEGRVWAIISSVVTFGLGIYILFALPFAALWVPGLLLGIDLVFSGVSMIAYGTAVHKPSRHAIHAH
jgi:uncharacterized membrane protein HdeD (DUF308 family)